MTGRRDLFEESLRLGHSAAWDSKWDRAIEFYRKALAEFPEDGSALSSLGLALLETGRVEEALSVYQRAVKASPDDPIPAEKCAEIYERLGDTKQAISQRELSADLHVRQRNADKAIENWSHSARLAPENLAVRSRLALTFERLGRKREAAHEYLAAASILQQTRKMDRAIEAAQMALRLAPTDPEATSALRTLRQGRPLPPPSLPRSRTGPLRMAEVSQFLKADTVPVSQEDEGDHDDPEISAQRQALSILASMLFDEQDDEHDDSKPDTSLVSRGRSGRLRESAGRSSRFRDLGQAIDLQTRGNKRQAAKEFKKAIDSGLDHPAAHYNLAMLLKELHDEANAGKHFMAALGHPELSLGANLALGRLFRTRDDLTEAARYLLQALRLADSLSVGENQSTQLNQLYDTILATQTGGDNAALSKIVENTLSFLSGPKWLHRVKTARQQLASQSVGPSVVPIAEMLAVGGTDQVVQALERIDEWVTQGQLGAAMEEAMIALDFAPNYLGIHLRMADILIQIGRRDAGLDKLTSIAETHRVRGESVQASKIYNRILRISPIDIRARTKLIELLAQQDRTEEALKQFLELADLYRQMAELDKARKALSDAMELAQIGTIDRTWVVRILHQIGDIDVSRLDFRRAQRVYQQICNLDPNDTMARRNVIDFSLRLGAEEQAGKDLDSYLQHLVQAGRGAEALSFLEELTRENPGKSVLHARLAEAYKAIGRKTDAIEQYDVLGEIQLDAGQLQEAIRTIRAIIDLKPSDLDGYRELLRNLEAGR
ncbi:MAG TPA: tetratricopeptide repeat protein [Anaerolineales bacterium]|nr:tetratricopeptide repeat protein [Anaerolineales bacterium]